MVNKILRWLKNLGRRQDTEFIAHVNGLIDTLQQRCESHQAIIQRATADIREHGRRDNTGSK